MKDIKKSRVGPTSYYPVVAMPPDNALAASGSQQSIVKTSSRNGIPKVRNLQAQRRMQTIPNLKWLRIFPYVVDESKTMAEMTPEEIDVFLARVCNDCYWVHHLRHQRSHSRAAEEALPGCWISSSTTGATAGRGA